MVAFKRTGALKHPMSFKDAAEILQIAAWMDEGDKEEDINGDLTLHAPVDRLSYCIKNAIFL